jgi:hypothetical protein
MGLARIAALAADGPWFLVTGRKGCLMSRAGEHVSWLILAYRLPGEPARLRSTVWRRLKAAGALYLANSVAALPASPAAERVFRRLRSDITGMGGSAQLLCAGALAGGTDLVRLFNAARDEEYAQVIAACDQFMGMIGSWGAGSHPGRAGLEQADRELARLIRWCGKVRARDTFGAGRAESAAAVLAKCQDAVDELGAGPGWGG